MNSPHQREQLPDLLSDALTDDERARVESHLRECAQCARELRQLEQMQAAVAALPVAPVPVRVRANVRAQLRQKPQRSFALPFALPLKTSQIAWGGAAVVGAVGLMLLGRPSLQNDSYSRSAPVSETEMAAGAAKSGSAPSAALAPQTDATDGALPPNVAPKPATPKADLNGTAPEPMAPLPAPPRPAKPRSDALANDAPASDAPGGAMPSFAFPSAPAPLTPPEIDKSNSRSVAPRALEPKPKPKEKNNRNSEATDAPAKPAPRATKMGPQEPNAPKISEQLTPSSSAADSASLQSSVGRSTAPDVPPMGALPAPMASNNAGKSALSQQPGAARPNMTLGRNAPAPADSARKAAGGDAVADFAAPAALAKWPGGAVKATLGSRAQTRRGDEAESPGTMGRFRLVPPPKFPLVLNFSVANPIGKARLILLTPNGEQTIWRGELNAQTAQVELSQATIEKASGKSGQTLRARLEQIGGDDNPISSSTFELPMP